MFAEDRNTAIPHFKEFNQIENNDKCLDERIIERTRLSDEETRQEIIKIVEGIDIAQVKSLPKTLKDEVRSFSQSYI
jgi:hypothetical protein